jgi:hypothetical protein
MAVGEASCAASDVTKEQQSITQQDGGSQPFVEPQHCQNHELPSVESVSFGKHVTINWMY